MSVRLAIHGTAGFASRWRDHAARCGHTILSVNGYDSEILRHLQGCDAFLWQVNQDQAVDLDHARNILEAARLQGVRVFPNHETCWHFDDKVAQKYLLEAIDAPLAKTWVFFSRRDAAEFLKTARYPLVFKLRRGAGALNVRMVKDRHQAAMVMGKMFGRGLRSFPVFDRIQRSAARVRVKEPSRDPILVRGRRVLKFFIQQTFFTPRERGYVLFQEFVADNDHDIRVTVIGNRAFAFKRGVRPNDFRASGSGNIVHLTEAQLPVDAIRVAFDISRALGFQSMAYDFVRDPANAAPLLLEISYSFQAKAVHDCLGYVDESLHWHGGHYWPEDLIMDDLVATTETTQERL